ncbi:hypothetical protein GQX73_g5536 [Xylaria multiplex]|uniref:Uncharacterized protein n=1 Tax=Xylaria multiplex TaxID=323545 RepID=A0A7C8IN80_9PEZI|nr:hypothetical protein GQX73_g5536 [Xylaria multiplex]
MATSSNRACDPANFPDWASLTSVPKNITVGGLSTGNDDCALWCEIPKNMTGMEWQECAFEYAPNLQVVTYRKASSTATAMRPTIMSVAVVVMLISGLYSW